MEPLKTVTDPAVLPWHWCWLGLVLAACGAVLALHGNEQRRPSDVARTGVYTMRAGACVTVLGAVLLLGPPLVNGGVMLLYAISDMAHAAVASARPVLPSDQSPDR